MAKQTWNEKDFEQWFVSTQSLLGERLLHVRSHPVVGRLADLWALDADGRLVLIEVKNERAARSAIGQVVEYVAALADFRVEELDADFAEQHATSIAEAYRGLFEKDLTFSATSARALLVAPEFGPHAHDTVKYLNDRLNNVRFTLVEAQQRPDGTFATNHYVPLPLVPASTLDPGAIVQDRRNAIYVVLTSLPTPLLWRVGRLKDDGELRLLGPTLRYGAIVRRDVSVRPPAAQVSLDLSRTGQTWVRKNDPHACARLLGVVQAKKAKGRAKRLAVYAKFKDGAFHAFRSRDLGSFRRFWRPADVACPGWLEAHEQALAWRNA